MNPREIKGIMLIVRNLNVIVLEIMTITKLVTPGNIAHPIRYRVMDI